MPSTSPKQARFMDAVAHDPAFAAKVGVPQKVGEEFNQADKGTGVVSSRRRSLCCASAARPMASLLELLGQTWRASMAQSAWSAAEQAAGRCICRTYRSDVRGRHRTGG